MTPLIWLALGVIIMAAEIAAPGFIVFWFGLGALLTALLMFAGIIESVILQWLIFFSSSIIFLILWFKVLKGRLSRDAGNDQRDPTLYSLRGRCTARIKPGKPGEVELYESYHGLIKWKAESSDIIDVNDEIRVLEASGIKLIVKKYNGREQ